MGYDPLKNFNETIQTYRYFAWLGKLVYQQSITEHFAFTRLAKEETI